MKSKYNYDYCKEISLKYTSLLSFRKFDQYCYIVSLKNGWIDSFTWLKRESRIKWTYEEAFKKAKQYDSLTKFRKENEFLYNKAKKLSWLNDYTWLRTEISVDLDKKSWKVYAYLIEGYFYVGLTRRDLIFRHKEHLHSKKDSLFKFCKETGLILSEPILLKDNISAEEAQYFEDFYIKEYSSLGKIKINNGKTGVSIGSLGLRGVIWTKESCLEEAKKYKSRTEFKHGAPRAYTVSVSEGWIEDYTWFARPKPKNQKSVIKLDLNNNIIERYESITEASIKNGIPHRTLAYNCDTGVPKNGFLWRTRI